MDLKEKTIRKIYVYRGRIMNIRNDDAQLPDGKIVSREVVEHCGGVCVLPVTDDGDVLLVRQWRYPYEEICTELPAGRLDREETPLEGGLRELREETGMEASEVFDLGTDYPSPGYTDEVIHLYAARGLKDIGQKLDEGEYLDVVRLPYDEALELCYRGELPDSKTQILLLKYRLLEQAGRLEERRVTR
ncbi:MAG: NUDIX hydrolase [Clostridia bacterium]|nr:NUDIX hydrolase [Clostridia bacterium]